MSDIFCKKCDREIPTYNCPDCDQITYVQTGREKLVPASELKAAYAQIRQLQIDLKLANEKADDRRDAHERAAVIAAEAHPCPYVKTSREGTSYCALAEDSVKRLGAQSIEAKDDSGDLRKTIDVVAADNARLEAALKAIRERAERQLTLCELDGYRIEMAVEYIRKVAQAALAPEPAISWKPEDGWPAGEDAVRAINEHDERGAREGE